MDLEMADADVQNDLKTDKGTVLKVIGFWKDWRKKSQDLLGWFWDLI